MRKIIALFVLSLGALAAGCAHYYTETPSVAGKAYVLRGGFFGSTMMMCDATSGKPVCAEVQER